MLSTSAAERVTSQLYAFVRWMMEQNYPCGALGCMPVSQVRGKLENGFAVYWTAFLEAGGHDIEIKECDLGVLIRSRTVHRRCSTTGDRAWTRRLVFPGVPGIGKSTTAVALQSLRQPVYILEQDSNWGDRLATLGHLHHAVRRRCYETIVISRCNACPKQYESYLRIALDVQCTVRFVSLMKRCPLSLSVALAGVLSRSEQGSDAVVVGRVELPFADVVGFSKNHFYDSIPVASPGCNYRHAPTRRGFGGGGGGGTAGSRPASDLCHAEPCRVDGTPVH